MAYGVARKTFLRTGKPNVSTLSDVIFQDSVSVFRDFFNYDSDKSKCQAYNINNLSLAGRIFLLKPNSEAKI